MKHQIPAPGYRKVSGHRAPPKRMGDMLHCQLRNGHCDPYGKPWPVSECTWKHDGSNSDIVAVKTHHTGEGNG